MNEKQIKEITNSSFNEKQQNALIQLFQRLTSEKKPNYLLWMVLSLNIVFMLLMLLFLVQPNLPFHYIQIGTQQVLSVSQVLPSDQRLIPKGASLDEGEVDEIIIELIPTYEAEVDVDVSIDVSSIAIGDINNPYNHLLVTQLYVGEISEEMNNVYTLRTALSFNEEIDQYSTLIYLRLFLLSPNEEESQMAYDSIAGKTIEFSINFTVIPRG